MTNQAPLRVGDVIEGFAGGSFGRDFYSDKRVEAIGADWVVARCINGPDEGMALFARGNPDQLVEYRRQATTTETA